MAENIETFGGLVISDTLVELGIHNTRLYTYLGSLAIYDHLFIDKTETTGAYLWRVGGQEEYFYYATLASMHSCTQYLNLQEVADLDRQAFDTHFSPAISDIDHIPSDWTIE